MPLSLLVVASETPDQRDTRRKHVGDSSDETYAAALRKIDTTCQISHVSCVDGDPRLSARELAAFDGVIFAGSPIQMQEDTPEARAAAAFMTSVFQSATPAFGSCAGLQIAAVAAGGTCKTREGGLQAGFARGIVATDAGRRHPLLQGRPISWTAPALHFSRVEALPSGAVVLAHAEGTPVEAAEIRMGEGLFWGVQYHPEIAVEEIAASVRRQATELVEQGLAAEKRDVEAYAAKLEAVPGRPDLAWQLGLDDEVLDDARRMREIANFLAYLHARAVTRPAA